MTPSDAYLLGVDLTIEECQAELEERSWQFVENNAERWTTVIATHVDEHWAAKAECGSIEAETPGLPSRRLAAWNHLVYIVRGRDEYRQRMPAPRSAKPIPNQNQ